MSGLSGRMMGAGLVWLGCLLTAAWAQAPAQLPLSGVVRDAVSGEPVANVTLQIEGETLVSAENARILIRTTNEGTYQRSLPAGEYTLSTTAEGYQQTRFKFTLSSGSGQVQNVSLRRLAAGAYRVETVPLPPSMIPEVSGIAFTPQGSLVAVNRRGEVWIRAFDTGQWRRFAYGLYEGFGVVAASETEVYVSQRPEITRVRDTDGDGQADTFDTLSDAWGITGNYHEFTYGLAQDRAGNLYGGSGMASAGDFPWTRGLLDLERMMEGPPPRDPHRSVVPYQGWVYQVTPNGGFVPLATGFRQPLGIGVSPEDEVFVTDVSGSWVPTSLLLHVEKGKFYGHPDGLKWHPEFRGKKVTSEMLREMRTLPAVYLPRGTMGTSPGQPAWDTTGGKFGPFEGQMFLGDVSSLIMRVDLEKVAGAYQGTVFPFVRNQSLRIGGMHNAFGPDGHFYVAQTVRGWMPAASEGIQRIVWNGQAPVEIHRIRITRDGFALSFTTAMKAEDLEAPTHYRVRRFQYNYDVGDGSLQVNDVEVPVTAVRPQADGRGVELTLLELLPGYVYELQLEGVHSREGEAMPNPIAYYTANRLLSGETYIAQTRLTARTATDDGPPDPAAGARVYAMNCVVCHQADGKGSPQVGTPNFTSAQGPLQKSDEDLIKIISQGGQAMPAFGTVLPARDIRNVLAYLRREFRGDGP